MSHIKSDVSHRFSQGNEQARKQRLNEMIQTMLTEENVKRVNWQERTRRFNETLRQSKEQKQSNKVER